LEKLGFEARLDPVGNLVARNCPADVPAIGIGSHCDSVRRGGRFDGTLGVLAAIEVARISRQCGVDLPLQVISWVEEEASGFGQMLLGSRLAAGLIDERALHSEVRALDDGRTFAEHARDVGLDPARFGQSRETLSGLSAWLELHIEQGRVLEEAGEQIGVVEAIAGYVHADIELTGRADHAGATPMGSLRRDAGAAAAAVILEAERAATAAGAGVVATIGELTLEPGAINIIAGRAQLSLDIRGPAQEALDRALCELTTAAGAIAAERELTMSYRERQRVALTTLDARVVATVEAAAIATGARWRRMVPGAAHDTMCIAPLVPSAMIFVPCRDGISHSPAEFASGADAAIGVEALLNAAAELARW
jgi:hydantoinase/carbamoylase family amidase